MEQVQEKCSECPHCQERARLEKEKEEYDFALLLSLVPLLVVTLFGQMGLF